MLSASRCRECILVLCCFVPGPIHPALLFGQALRNQSGSADEVQQLRAELQKAQADLASAQRRIDQLAKRVDMLEANKGTGAAAQAETPPSEPAYASPADIARQSKEESVSASSDMSESEKLLAARIEEQHQTKVESASKYRVKLSGLILMNAYSTVGRVDEPELPNLALSGGNLEGSFGATLRQSILGLQVFGPEIAGARTSGNVAIDFFGGVPQEPYGATTGIIRLRTATGRLDWKNTSLVFGQDAPFFSPLSPTSYATLAEPAMSWAGNLWVWTPQINVEHRFVTTENSFFAVSGGVLAPITADIPDSTVAPPPGPGERSRYPAFASQMSIHSKLFGREALFGIGGYTSHLVYDFGREANGWAATSFWQLPLAHWLELSGEAYRGKSVSGLGGGLSQNVVYSGDPGQASTQARFVNSVGGWSELKFRVHPKWELNAALGQDNVFGRDLEWAANVRNEYGTPLARNRIVFGNVVFRPKSNVLFSGEYRHIWTFPFQRNSNSADQVNLAAGVSF